jgi:hypothetical protein
VQKFMSLNLDWVKLSQKDEDFRSQITRVR